VFSAVAGEHSCTIAQFPKICTKMHEVAHLCMNEVC
jgi:hypothetical protein